MYTVQVIDHNRETDKREFVVESFVTVTAAQIAFHRVDVVVPWQVHRTVALIDESCGKVLWTRY